MLSISTKLLYALNQKMLKIGITGQEGFIGRHLYNTIGLYPDKFERIDCPVDVFQGDSQLETFVKQCDIIVHLAAMNRHSDPEVLFNTNIELVSKLIKALKQTRSCPHVLFSSSSQEEKDNLYGRSKKEGRRLLSEWAESSGGKFTGLVIPNVFGPFGRPNYNSFIATFCHKLTHQEQPVIEVDGAVKLIYVGDLVKAIIDQIVSQTSNFCFNIPHTHEYKVSEILALLENYRLKYFDSGIIPPLLSAFEVNLFNTFRSYIEYPEHFPIKYTNHIDKRGSFVEIIRLECGGQVSFSTTMPDITRGNHFHTRKIERFSVINGKALIQLRKIGSDAVIDFHLSGNDPSYVDMPVWYTHNIKNIGETELYTIFWINECYDPNDADTYFETV